MQSIYTAQLAYILVNPYILQYAKRQYSFQAGLCGRDDFTVFMYPKSA
jgi:hypothetical protein